MKILGIVGSTRDAQESGVHTLVSRVLEASGLDYEVVHLRGKTINGCRAIHYFFFILLLLLPVILHQSRADSEHQHLVGCK